MYIFFVKKIKSSFFCVWACVDVLSSGFKIMVKCSDALVWTSRTHFSVSSFPQFLHCLIFMYYYFDFDLRLVLVLSKRPSPWLISGSRAEHPSFGPSVSKEERNIFLSRLKNSKFSSWFVLKTSYRIMWKHEKPHVLC